jgi:hypothetical protein
MSKIALEGNVSGSGTLTIAAPNTNSNFTLSLPTNTGTILTNATTAGFPAGSVLQVVQAVSTTRTVGTSTSYVDITGLSASITPSSASNKILIMFCLSGGTARTGGGGESRTDVQLVRTSTGIVAFTGYNLRADVSSNESNMYALTSGQYLDSPNTTSSVTYKLQIKDETGGRSYDINAQNSSTITLMEIAA